MTTRPGHTKAKAPHRAGRASLPHPRSVPHLEQEGQIAQEPEQPFVEGAHDEIDPDLRHRMISEAAYRLYEERGYGEGYEVDDWRQAETSVDHLLLKPKPAPEG